MTSPATSPAAVLHQAQLADDVGDAGAAGQPVVGALLVGQPGPGQRLGDRPGLGVGAVQDGDVGQPDLAVLVPVGPAAVQGVERRAAEELVDGGGDPARLGVLVGRLVQGDDTRGSGPRAATAVRPGTRVDGAMACPAAVTMAGFER